MYLLSLMNDIYATIKFGEYSYNIPKKGAKLPFEISRWIETHNDTETEFLILYNEQGRMVARRRNKKRFEDFYAIEVPNAFRRGAEEIGLYDIETETVCKNFGVKYPDQIFLFEPLFNVPWSRFPDAGCVEYHRREKIITPQEIREMMERDNFEELLSNYLELKESPNGGIGWK